MIARVVLPMPHVKVMSYDINSTYKAHMSQLMLQIFVVNLILRYFQKCWYHSFKVMVMCVRQVCYNNIIQTVCDYVFLSCHLFIVHSHLPYL